MREKKSEIERVEVRKEKRGIATLQTITPHSHHLILLATHIDHLLWQ